MEFEIKIKRRGTGYFVNMYANGEHLFGTDIADIETGLRLIAPIVETKLKA